MSEPRHLHRHRAGRRWPVRSLVAGGLALTLAGAAGWYAEAATSNTIHACAAKQGGALRLRPASGCAASEKAVSWNKVGPRGPAGVVAGYVGRLNSSASRPAVKLTGSYKTIIGTPALPHGIYLVTATINLAMYPDAGTACVLRTALGNGTGSGQQEAAQTPPGSSGDNANLAIADEFHNVTANDRILLLCRDYHAGAQATVANNALIEAIPAAALHLNAK